MAVYLITGGARGIGVGIAAKLRREGHAIFHAGPEKTDLPGVRSVFCDLEDSAQVASLLYGVEAIEGRLDGLLCDAVMGDAPDENFAGTAQLINAASNMLRATRGAALAIDIAGNDKLPAFTLALARALGPEIRVNSFAPALGEETSRQATQLAAYLLGPGHLTGAVFGADGAQLG